MTRSNAFKEDLIALFDNLDSIGVFLADVDTDETELVFQANPKNVGKLFRSTHRLPDGKGMYESDHCADYVIACLGEGVRYGFHIEQNPSVANPDIRNAVTHSFPVLRKRFIVDIWVSLYAQSVSQVVYDLQDKADRKKLESLYGDPANWCWYDAVQRIYLHGERVPVPLRLQFGPPFKLIETTLP
jgi:hypothetical protein